MHTETTFGYLVTCELLLLVDFRYYRNIIIIAWQQSIFVNKCLSIVFNKITSKVVYQKDKLRS